MDGILFDKNQTTLIQYPGNRTGHYKIPGTVTSIQDRAFYACDNLTSITIPACVTRIWSNAFDSCSSLSGVYFNGDAPGIDTAAFNNSIHATIYYMPWTSGWTDPWAGRPAVPWNPQVKGDDSYGVRGGCFGFSFTNAGNPIVVIDACTNLAIGIWTPVSTNTLTGGASCFSDPAWTNHPGRFYRFSTL